MDCVGPYENPKYVVQRYEMAPDGLFRLNWMFTGRGIGEDRMNPMHTHEPVYPASKAKQRNQ
jgi:hypothetical protein